jgi:lipopolysaccharide transport system ATP-binding protein
VPGFHGCTLMAIIRVSHLSKKYSIYRTPADKLREVLHFPQRTPCREFWALRDVSFKLEKGQSLGIIGRNGSGKSTLLQILAGIMRQTSGDCQVSGKVSALLELGSGFNAEFTGRENVFMNGAILGLDTRQIQARFEAIADFADIGDFMEQPMKTYSSGMFMRLAFAVAVNVDPAILLVDEALAVGDLMFQHRCMHRMSQLRAAGKTTVLVTHDLSAVTKFCDRALLLDEGRLLADGPPEAVVNRYRALIFERERRFSKDELPGERQKEDAANTEKEMPVVRSVPNIDHRFGNGKARVIGVELMNSNGQPIREVAGGETVLLRISVEFLEHVTHPILGYTMRDRVGVEISACNTTFAGDALPPAARGQVFTSDFQITVPCIASGSYSISPAVAEGELLKHDMCDWIDNGLVFSLYNSQLIYGMLSMDVNVRSYYSKGEIQTQTGARMAQT